MNLLKISTAKGIVNRTFVNYVAGFQIEQVVGSSP